MRMYLESIPYDEEKVPLGWPNLHGLTRDVDERTQEHEEHEEHQEERPEHKNTHKIQEPFPLPVGPTGPIESTRRWEIGK